MNTSLVYSPEPSNSTKTHGLDCHEIGNTVWYFRVSIQGLLFATSAVLNFLNLVVFRRWKQKDPYLNFHIALSASGLACALCGLIFVMDIPYSSSPELRLILGNASVRTFGTFNEYLLIIISMDRWISIEFRSFYHHRISRNFVTAIITLAFLYVSVQNMIVFSVLKNHWVTSALCGIRASAFVYEASWYKIYYGVFLTVLKYLLLLPTQVRLCWMGVRFKRRKNRRVMDIRIVLTRSQTPGGSPTTPSTSNQEALDNVEVADPRHPGSKFSLQLWRSYATTVLAGSAVVIVSVVCTLPITLIYYFGSSRPDLFYITLYASMVYQLRDICPFFIYLSFYPEYRRAFAKLRNDVGKYLRSVDKPFGILVHRIHP